jgi:hypothetical protein
MTTFKGPLQLGVNTGAPTTDTRGFVPVYKVFALSAAAKTVTQTMEAANNTIMLGTVYVLASVEGSAKSATIRVGDSTDSDKFGQINVSGRKFYSVALSAACVSAGTELIVDATAAVSGASFSTFDAKVYIGYIPQGG